MQWFDAKDGVKFVNEVTPTPITLRKLWQLARIGFVTGYKISGRYIFRRDDLERLRRSRITFSNKVISVYPVAVGE